MLLFVSSLNQHTRNPGLFSRCERRSRLCWASCFPFQDVCSLLKHASCLVPFSQEHLVIKFCQLVHHLLNQLKVTTILNRMHVCKCAVLLESLWQCPVWFLLSVLNVAKGNNGRADIGCIGELYHQCAESVQYVDTLRYPPGALHNSVWEWTPVPPGRHLHKLCEHVLWYVITVAYSHWDFSYS